MSIVERKRKDGTATFTAQVRRYRDGQLVFNRTQTFHRRKLAEQWQAQVEAELAQGLLSRPAPITFKELITRYLEEYPSPRRKIWDLRYLQRFSLCEQNVYGLTSAHYIQHIKDRLRSVQPQTVKNDLIWLQQVIEAANFDWGLAVPTEPLADARRHATRNRWVAPSQARDRRLTPDEEQRLRQFFRELPRQRIPMETLMDFALQSTRRQEEIVLLRWEDLDAEKRIIKVRKVKHPRHKERNDRVARLTDEALALIQAQPRTSEFIFPYNSRSVCAAFTRACRILGIEDLHFHDLRHEAISRLFARGYAIHEVALFSLHTSWNTLKRYTHLRPEDLKNR